MVKTKKGMLIILSSICLLIFCMITVSANEEIRYEIEDEDLILYYSGEKTYDQKGNNYSQSCKVGWKLFDSEGYVVTSGTFYTPNIAVGEKFRDKTEKAYGCIKPGETYTLKISDVD